MILYGLYKIIKNWNCGNTKNLVIVYKKEDILRIVLTDLPMRNII